MNKKLIVAAVAAAVVAPAAFAEVEVYGKAHLSVGQYDNEGSDNASWFQMDRNNSHVGFRGADDLGNGMKGVFQLETSFETDTGGIGGSGRDSFVGLESDFGWVAVGRHNTPYKMSTNSFDIAGDSPADYNAILGISPNGIAHDTRVSNALRFKSKDMNGLGVDVLYGFTGTAADGADKNTNRERNLISLAATYRQGPIEAAGAYDSFAEHGAASGSSFEDDVAMKAGAKFFFMDNQAWVAGLYENVDGGGNNNDRDAFYVSGLLKAGQWAFGAGYAMADKVGNTENSGATLLQLQAKHSLSKATNWYVQVASLDIEKAAVDPAGGYGLSFGTVFPGLKTGEVAGTNDKTVQFIGVGIQTDFSSK